jgi:hypothetical protein
MSQTNPSLTVIIPVYNEARRIGRFIETIPDRSDLEFIWVCNGCTDQSKETIESQTKKQTQTQHKIILSEKGKGAAIQAGLKHANPSSSIVGWTDADGAIPWQEIEVLSQKAKSENLPCFGQRSLSNRHRLRGLISKCSNFVAQWVAGHPLPKDVGCPAKFFPRHLAPQLHEMGWSVDTEAALRTTEFKEVKIHSQDIPGSHFTTAPAIRNALRCLALFGENRARLCQLPILTFSTLLILIILGTVLRFLYPFYVNPMQRLFSDPMRHYSNAKLLFDYPFDKITPLLDPTGYQLCLNLFLKITQEKPFWVALATGFLCAITPWIWYGWMREVTPKKNAALLFLAVLAWLPSWIGIYGFFMPETLVLPLAGLALWATWRTIRRKTQTDLLLATILWTAATLTKATVLPIAIITMVTALYGMKSSWKGRFSTVLGHIILVVLIYLAAGWRSYVRLGEWEPLGHPQLNAMYMKSGQQWIEISYTRNGKQIEHQGFQSPSVGGYQPFLPLSQWTSSRSGKYATRVEILDPPYKRWENAALQLKDPALSLSWKRRIELSFENMIFFLFGASWPDNNRADWIQTLQIELRWIWAPILGYVILRSILEKKKSLVLITCIATWLTLSAAQSGVAEARYRKVWEGVLIASAFYLSFPPTKKHSSPVL